MSEEFSAVYGVAPGWLPSQVGRKLGDEPLAEVRALGEAARERDGATRAGVPTAEAGGVDESSDLLIDQGGRDSVAVCCEVEDVLGERVAQDVGRHLRQPRPLGVLGNDDLDALGSFTDLIGHTDVAQMWPTKQLAEPFSRSALPSLPG